MPKLSVYVPDPLWDQVQAVRPGPVSEVIQECLRDYVDRQRATPRFAVELSPEMRHARDAVLEAMLPEARRQYEKGYRAGLALAETIGWDRLAELSEYFKFDVRRWVRAWQESEMRSALGQLQPGEVGPDENFYGALISAFGVWAAGDPEDGMFVPGPAYLGGLTMALRDLWKAAQGEEVVEEKTPF